VIVRPVAQPKRRGASLVEAAIVYPTTMLLMIATLVLGLAVFCYQQIAALAREGARYASVHGATYASESGQPYATSSTVMTNAIDPLIVGLNKNNLTCTVTWSPNPPSTSSPTTVTVELVYVYQMEAYFNSSFTLQSTSVMPVTY
jgi:Flp pilus assembly protein TadG